MKAFQNSPTSPLELSDLMILSPVVPILEKGSNVDSSENDGISTGREILKLALQQTTKKPQLLPSDYVRYLCDNNNDESQEEKNCYIGKDPVLNRQFYVVCISNDTHKILESYVPHPNLQRIYGYCDLKNDSSLLISEYFRNGTVASFLLNARRRVQLNAQRRVQIMIDTARVLHTQQPSLHISSSCVGLTSVLSTKVFATSSSIDQGDDDVSYFGILMIELLTGALQNNGSEDRKLGDFRHRYTNTGRIIEDDLDPYVRESWTFNILSQLIELALGCINEDPTKRPSAYNLVDTLTFISSRMQVVSYGFDM